MVSALLLAAGESTRMGQLKALLPWSGVPLIRYQAEQMLAAGVERLVIVVGHRAVEVLDHVSPDPRVAIVENPLYQTGKVSSILAGVRATPRGSHILIVGVDQPRPVTLVAQTIDAHLTSGASITIAGCAGRRGHPVVFAPALRPELLAIDEASQGLRAILQRHATAVRVIDTGSPLALVNLNSADDYAAAQRLIP
jgi:molybdenum cofactor cytidylyltransferase